MSSFTTFVFTILALFALASCAPLEPRDVFVPPVLYPGAGTIWKIGARHNVTWNITNAPKQITNKIGMIILAKAGRLDIENPLATGFDILDGRHEITVPNVPTGNDYSVVVFGDSGNSGKEFTITN